MVTKILTELGKIIDINTDLFFNKKLENRKKVQSNIGNSIIEIKRTLEAMNGRLNDKRKHK